mgnify:CR=1 FL=1
MAPLLTLREVSGLLKVHHKTVYEWIYAGRLPAVNLGTDERASWRIQEDDLKSFIEGRIRSLKTEKDSTNADKRNHTREVPDHPQLDRRARAKAKAADYGLRTSS